MNTHLAIVGSSLRSELSLNILDRKLTTDSTDELGGPSRDIESKPHVGIEYFIYLTYKPSIRLLEVVARCIVVAMKESYAKSPTKRFLALTAISKI